MSNQLPQSTIINAQSRFLDRSYNTVKNHKLVSYITSSGSNLRGKVYTDFVITLKDGRCLQFRYAAEYEKAEQLFINAAIKLLRYTEQSGDLPASVLGRMVIKATDKIE